MCLGAEVLGRDAWLASWRSGACRLAARWLLLDLGGRSANIEQAQQLFAAALATQNGAVQTVFANAAQAYYDTWAAQAALAGLR